MDRATESTRFQTSVEGGSKSLVPLTALIKVEASMLACTGTYPAINVEDAERTQFPGWLGGRSKMKERTQFRGLPDVGCFWFYGSARGVAGRVGWGGNWLRHKEIDCSRI